MREPSNITATRESPVFRRGWPAVSRVETVVQARRETQTNRSGSRRCPTQRRPSGHSSKVGRLPSRSMMQGRIVAGDVRGIEQNTRKNETRRVRNRKDQRRRLSQWSRGRPGEPTLPQDRHAGRTHRRSWSSRPVRVPTRNHPNGRGYHCRNCVHRLLTVTRWARQHSDSARRTAPTSRWTRTKKFMSNISGPRRSLTGRTTRAWSNPRNRGMTRMSPDINI